MTDEQINTVRVALTLAARTFDTYAMVHRATRTNDGAEKAEANRVMALRMYEALEQIPSKAPANTETK